MYQYITLPNGVKIGLFQMDDVKSVALKAMITAGPVIEDDTQNGASHFLEHIVLCGTKSYPTKLAFAEALEDLGVSYGGYTSTQEMAFEFDVPYTNIDKTLDILKEILFAPSFTDEIIEKERNVILEEMQDRENSPDFQFYYKTLEMRFREPSHVLAKKVIGRRDIIQTISKEALRSLYAQLFIPSNLYICIVGNIDLQKVREHLERLFGDIPDKGAFTRPSFTNKDLSGYGKLLIPDEKFSNVYTNISFAGYPREVDDKTELSIRIFSAMLSGLRTSRLFQDVREKEGLVYNIASDWYSSWGVGTFSISFEADAARLDRILEIVYKDITDIKIHGFTNEALEHMKSYFNNRTLLSFSSPGKINQWLMDYIYENEQVLFPEDLIEMGSSITQEDVRAVIDRSFDFATMNILMMGKLDGYNLDKTLQKIQIPSMATAKKKES